MLKAFGWKKETECLNLGVNSFPGAFPVQGLWTSSQNYSFVNGNVDFDFDTNEIRSEHGQLERATLFNAELVLVDPELASASVVDIEAKKGLNVNVKCGLPWCYFWLTSLTSLYLPSNSFVGTIPTEIGLLLIYLCLAILSLVHFPQRLDY